MVQLLDHALRAFTTKTSSLRFNGAVGRTNLISGRYMPGIESSHLDTDHTIIFRYEGSTFNTRHEIANGPRRSGPMPRRQLSLIPAHSLFHRSDGGGENIRSLVVSLPPQIVDESYNEPGTEVVLRPGLGIEDDEVYITLEKIRCAAEHAQSFGPSYRTYHGYLLRLLAFEIAKSHGTPVVRRAATRGGLSNRHARLLTAYLAEYHARAIPIDELAALVSLNRSHMSEAFRQSTGLAPHQFQTARRLDRAKQLLTEGKLSLAEIALAVGYSNQSQFGAMFRKNTGFSPGRYRKEAMGR